MSDVRYVVVPLSVKSEEPPVIHTPSTAKQPVFPAAVMRLMPPPWKVLVAVVEAKIPEEPASENNVDGDVVPMPILSFPASMYNKLALVSPSTLKS